MSAPNDEYIIDTKNLRISYASVGIALFSLFFLWLAWGLFLNQWLGTTTVGSMWAKTNFDTQYWVYIQPQNAETKNYRVKGDVSRVDGIYSLTQIYWDNGGYLTFDECSLQDDNGVYTSEDDCESSKWLNDDDGYERYSVRVDQEVPPQQIQGGKQ
jgi:hypothetical protein